MKTLTLTYTESTIVLNALRKARDSAVDYARYLEAHNGSDIEKDLVNEEIILTRGMIRNLELS